MGIHLSSIRPIYLSWCTYMEAASLRAPHGIRPTRRITSSKKDSYTLVWTTVLVFSDSCRRRTTSSQAMRALRTKYSLCRGCKKTSANLGAIPATWHCTAKVQGRLLWATCNNPRWLKVNPDFSSNHRRLISLQFPGMYQRVIISSGSSLHTWALGRNKRQAVFQTGQMLGIMTNNSRELVSALQNVSATSLFRSSLLHDVTVSLI